MVVLVIVPALMVMSLKVNVVMIGNNNCTGCCIIVGGDDDNTLMITVITIMVSDRTSAARG